MSPTPSSILISRTDAIGDVVLTLPVAALLKERFPQATIGFLAKAYTLPVVEACPHVDESVLLEDFLHRSPARKWDTIIHVFPTAQIAARAKQLRIKYRIGTTNRIYHWWTCNHLVRLSRRNSELHEAQLNLKLLRPLGIEQEFSLNALRHLKLLKPSAPLPEWLNTLLRKCSRNIVLHPTSMGSAREWGFANFQLLAVKLLSEGYSVFITGTQKDHGLLQPMIEALGPSIHDLSGRLTLPELLSFIGCCDAVVAGSTGPLHLGAALNVVAVGLYPSERPMHPGRWAPLGLYGTYLTSASFSEGSLEGLPGITPEAVFQKLKEKLMKVDQTT